MQHSPQQCYFDQILVDDLCLCWSLKTKCGVTIAFFLFVWVSIVQAPLSKTVIDIIDFSDQCFMNFVSCLKDFKPF